MYLRPETEAEWIQRDTQRHSGKHTTTIAHSIVLPLSTPSYAHTQHRPDGAIVIVLLVKNLDHGILDLGIVDLGFGISKCSHGREADAHGRGSPHTPGSRQPAPILSLNGVVHPGLRLFGRQTTTKTSKKTNTADTHSTSSYHAGEPVARRLRACVSRRCYSAQRQHAAGSGPCASLLDRLCNCNKLSEIEKFIIRQPPKSEQAVMVRETLHVQRNPLFLNTKS